MLTVKKISKSFSGNKVLKELSLEGEAGEVLGVIGANGAGKSTLFKCISGELVVDAGEILLEDSRIQNKTARDIFNLGVVRCFQKAVIIPDLTVIENVLIGAHARLKYNLLDVVFRDSKFIREEKKNYQKAKAILESFNMDASISDQATSLSMLDIRKVELARAMVSNPKCLLIDEITAGLNSVETDSMKNWIISLKKKDKLIVVVEHNVDFLSDLCDRILVIDDGKKVMIGTPTEVKKNEKVKLAYLGEGFVQSS